MAGTHAVRSKLTTLGTALLFLLITFLGYENVLLNERIDSNDARVSDIATRFIEHRREALSRDEMGSVRSHIEGLLQSALQRVSKLENRSGATARVIGSALPSVIFLQGAYRFEDEKIGRPLRYMVGPDGQPVMTLGGPAMSVKGDGPVVELQFTGTAFVATEDRLLITNRHLVRPWEEDDAAKMLISRGFVPVMYRLVGYVPGKAEPIDVELFGMSDEADVAILKSDDLPPEIPSLNLNPVVPEPGESVIVMGYPTGMQALLVRAGHRFVDELRQAQHVDFWRVARELSNQSHINPLASLGIVGQATATFVVYDAETARGGSGGPVLGLDGRVLAINSAVIPGFNGSNLGVPIEQALRLLDGLIEQS
ncbi:MAG TPA: serine protease [Gammaproteobacteria bacterium]|nr:serine protease [Gammaproteobacteria bacterium]